MNKTILKICLMFLLIILSFSKLIKPKINTILKKIEIPENRIRISSLERDSTVTFEIGASGAIKNNPIKLLFTALLQGSKKILASENYSNFLNQIFFNLISLGVNGDTIKFGTNSITRFQNSYLSTTNGELKTHSKDTLDLLQKYFELNNLTLKITKIIGNLQAERTKIKVEELKELIKGIAEANVFKCFKVKKIPIGKFLFSETTVDGFSNSFEYGNDEEKKTFQVLKI